MKTYYFTICTRKKKFEKYANFLKNSMEKFGIDLNIVKLPNEVSVYDLRMAKIQGVRNVPEGYDRVFYLDADTAMINPGNSDLINGMLLERTGHRKRKYYSRHLDDDTKEIMYDKLNKLLDSRNLSEMKLESGGFGSYEWNGGVLVGDLKFANELCDEWEKWIHDIMEIHDGCFFRDQIALKYAYYNIGYKKYGFETIPKEWNWGIKWWGLNKDAIILHEAGWREKRNAWREKLWTGKITKYNRHPILFSRCQEVIPNPSHGRI